MTPEMLQIVFMLVILGGMFFFMYRSQKKQQKLPEAKRQLRT